VGPNDPGQSALGLIGHRCGNAQLGNGKFAMRVLIVFSTTEGHTRKLAQFAAARLTSLGHQVQVHDAAQSDAPDPAGLDCALLFASVHVGRSFN
jgi:hypothetical protein